MTLKEKIQKDFLKYLKEKYEPGKSALNSLKAKITEAEKLNKNTEISESEIIKIVNKSIKQREESAKIYSDAGRVELASNELLELNVLMDYMPAQMSEEEIKNAVSEILNNIPNTLPENARIGKTMGEFNKKYQGMADSSIVSKIIKLII